MAFNWQTFRIRALTALVFVAVMLTGLLWNHWSFLILFSIIHFGCWWEYLSLVEKIKKIDEININLKLGLMILGYAIMLYTPIVSNFIKYQITKTTYVGTFGLQLNFHFILLLAGTILTFIGVRNESPKVLKSFGLAALGLVYISLSWGFLSHLREIGSEFEGAKIHEDLGYTIPFGIIVSIWINDTMAYIVGSIIGKTPLSKISPKKTWEGTIGGIILSVLVTGFLYNFLANRFMYPMIQQKHWFFIATISAIAGTFGDLLESKLKRLAGVKDSGSLMPGHGGFLDRFDSLLIATPFVWLYVFLFL